MQNSVFIKLRRFNLFMGCLHFVQGLMMLVLSLTWSNIKDFTPVIYSYFLKFDTQSMRLVTTTDQLFKLPFGILVSSFLFLSALAHFIISIPKKTNDIYNSGLKKNINQFRWYEYALSSSLMMILIAVLFGVYDIGSLILMFVLNAAMNLFGLLMEKMNQNRDKTDWTAFIFGSVAGIGPWIIIALYGFGNANPADVPWFVYAIVGTYFLFFNLFPINMILQYRKKGKWADYLHGERGYIILSLCAKTVLAWLVLFGVMQP